MGWSGYCPRWSVSFHVDAHGGEAEDRGEQLYRECVDRIEAAVKAVIGDPKYAEISPLLV